MAQAEDRSGILVRVSGDLDVRATALKPIEKQLAHFEELLGRWESAQGEAARALEQTLARQAAVEALEAQVKHVFGMAERAVEDVQTIGSARREIEDTRNLLEETQAQFKADVCGRITVMFDCTGGIYVDVQNYPAFSSVNVSNPIDASKNFTNPNNYNPGGPGDIVVVRLFYQWPILVTKFGYDITNLSGSKRLLVATAAFQNEPY